MHALLLQSDLIAHIQILTHTQQQLKVRVVGTLRNFKTGIVQGDYLRVAHDFQVVCPQGFPEHYAEEQREAVAFLRNEEAQWQLVYGKIAFMEAGKASLDFYEEGYCYTATLDQWHRDLNTYYQHFSLNQKGQLISRLQADNWQEASVSNLAYLQYAAHFNSGQSGMRQFSVLKPLFTSLEGPKEEPQWLAPPDSIYNFAYTPPISDSVMRIIRVELSQRINQNAMVNQHTLLPNTYFSLLFEKDGRVSEVQIYRSAHAAVDELLRSYFKENARWPPAQDQRGNPIRFRQRMVFRYRDFAKEMR